MTDKVYITTETAEEAEHYHTSDCQGILAEHDRKEITEKWARANGATLCSFCSGNAYVQGPAQKLLEMDADDVLGGGKA